LSHRAKVKRQRRLQRLLSENPFYRDRELAEMLQVSVQTVRLDRVALGIPELRQRTKEVAERTYGVVRTLGCREIVGELVDLELGRHGISILETTEDMTFERSPVVRSQYIFAQADSLALAVVDAPEALTGLANAKFKRSVQVGERLVAKAEVIRRRSNKYVVLVQTRAERQAVFRGKFVVAAIGEEKEAAR